MSQARQELERAIGKKWTKRVVIALAVLAVYAVISFFANLWPFSSALGVARRVSSAEAIVQNYEWFYDQYHAIEAQRRNVALMPEGSTDRIGTQMVLNNMIAEYNARSQSITRNLWKADDLPYQIGE
jgi:hypothetical protein